MIMSREQVESLRPGSARQSPTQAALVESHLEVLDRLSTMQESCAQLLETWSELRSGYLSHAGRNVVSANDIEALASSEQLVWAQVESFKQAANVLRDPMSTMSIPTWLEDKWEDAAKRYRDG